LCRLRSARLFTAATVYPRKSRPARRGLTVPRQAANLSSVSGLVWKFEGRLAVAVHGASDPSNLEWAGYLRDTLAQPDISRMRVLVVSHGGGPNGQQRKSLMDGLLRPAPTAYLSNKWVARSLINTMSWFNPQLRAFGLGEDSAAFQFLQLTENEQRIARKFRAALEAQVQIPPQEEARSNR